MLYAIQHTSGEYLKVCAGGSWWEGEAQKGPLHLFKTLGAAKGWKTCWLKGRLVKHWERSHGYFGEDDYVTYTYEPQEGRKTSDIHIIPVELIFGEPL